MWFVFKFLASEIISSYLKRNKWDAENADISSSFGQSTQLFFHVLRFSLPGLFHTAYRKTLNWLIRVNQRSSAFYPETVREFEKSFENSNIIKTGMSIKLDNTKKLAIITFFSNLYFYNHIGTLYQQTRGLNLLQVSSIWSIIVGTIFLAEVPTGILADKIGRKWSIVTALFLQTLGEFLYFVAKDYFAFIFIAILAGIGYAFLSGANEALVYDSLPEKDRETNMKKSMGLIGSSYQLAFFTAPIFGGLIVSQLVLEKFLIAILLTACSVTIAFMISFSLKEPQNSYKRAEESPLTIFREGFNEIRNSRRLKWLIAIAVLTSTFSNSLISLYQPYFADASVPTFWIGASLSLGGLLAFILQKYAYRIEQKLGKLGFFAVSVWPGIMYILLAMVSLPALLITFFILAYASMELRNPLLSSYKNEHIKSKNRATVLSLFNMFGMLYVALMGLVFGRIADYSIPIAFTSIGFLIVLFAIILRTDKVAVLGDHSGSN